MFEKLRRLFTKSAEAGPSSSAGHGMKPLPPTMNDVEKFIRAGEMILAIKAYRDVTGAGLKEAKEAVEAMEAMARGEAVKVETIADVVSQIKAGQMIPAIKTYRALTGVGLKEAKEAVEAMARGEPVKNAPTMPLAATIDDVVSQVKAGQMIHAIKTYREITGAGLKEAKEAVDALAAEYRTGRDH